MPPSQERRAGRVADHSGSAGTAQDRPTQVSRRELHSGHYRTGSASTERAVRPFQSIKATLKTATNREFPESPVSMQPLAWHRLVTYKLLISGVGRHEIRELSLDPTSLNYVQPV